MEITTLFKGQYQNKRVLITGDTGFKGSWLALWLQELGALVYGISLKPETQPNHFDLLSSKYDVSFQNILDKEALTRSFERIKPDIVFHLAAQSLVRHSYDDPYQTYMTNVMGTVNVLEAARSCEDLKAIVVVTSDKCYENNEWVWGYRENEPMGGRDPYSSSKGCTELIVSAYRSSFFTNELFEHRHNTLLASVRAGNVIGGGDWATDRIVPDMIKSAASNTPLYLRYPDATRPWQHVLEPLSGYLMVGQKLLEGDRTIAEAWNFGPSNDSNLSVLELVTEAKKNWSDIAYDIDASSQPHEAGFLMLDSTKAIKKLGWNPIWDFSETVRHTVYWYKEFYNNNLIVSSDQLYQYMTDAAERKVEWTIVL